MTLHRIYLVILIVRKVLFITTAYTMSVSNEGEQLTLNQWVLGSSPRWCTKNSLTET